MNIKHFQHILLWVLHNSYHSVCKITLFPIRESLKNFSIISSSNKLKQTNKKNSYRCLKETQSFLFNQSWN